MLPKRSEDFNGSLNFVAGGRTEGGNREGVSGKKMEVDGKGGKEGGIVRNRCTRCRLSLPINKLVKITSTSVLAYRPSGPKGCVQQ